MATFSLTQLATLPDEELVSLTVFKRMYRTTNSMIRMLDTLCKEEWDLTCIQALFALSILGGAKQPVQIAHEIGAQSQTVTGVLDRMEDEGFVNRARDLRDRRAVRVEVTTKLLARTGGYEQFTLRFNQLAEEVLNTF